MDKVQKPSNFDFVLCLQIYKMHKHIYILAQKIDLQLLQLTLALDGWAVNIIPLPYFIHPSKKGPLYPLDRRLYRLHSQSGCLM